VFAWFNSDTASKQYSYIFMKGSKLAYEILKLWGCCPKKATVTLPTRAFKQGMFYIFRHITTACMTMMDNMFMHGTNGIKTTGCGKYIRTELNHNIQPWNDRCGNTKVRALVTVTSTTR
jgi:hypothetical protein